MPNDYEFWTKCDSCGVAVAIYEFWTREQLKELYPESLRDMVLAAYDAVDGVRDWFNAQEFCDECRDSPCNCDCLECGENPCEPCDGCDNCPCTCDNKDNPTTEAPLIIENINMKKILEEDDIITQLRKSIKKEEEELI